jgi:uncharacterized membrane protein
MSVPPPPTGSPPKPTPRPSHNLNEVGVLRALGGVVRSRILSGLLAALPLALTIFIVRYLYLTAVALLTPLIELVRYVLGNHGLSETFWYKYFAPVIAVGLVLIGLYALGLFVRTRWLRAVDWVILQVPIVNTIFKAISNVFQSLGQQLQGGSGLKRVVLVEFPNPGMRSLAFVTNTLRDATTDRTILCVTVLTGVMPPAGFTLFVPEEKVTDIDWSMNQALQAILSGGITAPATIHYFQGLRVPPTGPIVDAQGHPIAVPHDPQAPAGEPSSDARTGP